MYKHKFINNIVCEFIPSHHIKFKRKKTLPETWKKHCVRAAIANPDANAVASNTDEML